MMNSTGEVGMEAVVAKGGSVRKAETAAKYARRLPVGAEVQAGGGVHFRLWAARCQSVVVEVMKLSGKASSSPDVRIDLTQEAGGYFSGFVPEAEAGDRYWFLVDGDELRLT